MGEIEKQILEALILYGLDDEDEEKIRDIIVEAMGEFPNCKHHYMDDGLCEYCKDYFRWIMKWLY